MKFVNSYHIKFVVVISESATAAIRRKLRVVENLSCLLVHVTQAACDMYALAGVG